MVTNKPRIVIIGAGIAGLTAANKLYTSTISKQLFELSILEGGSRIGGRIRSSEFCGDRIEQGATWIHGIEGSPLYQIAEKEGLLHSPQPWECMDANPENFITIAEGGHELNPSIVEPISGFFKNLIDFVKGKAVDEECDSSPIVKHCISNWGHGNRSVGSFLRKGLEYYWGIMKDENGFKGVGNWNRKSLEEAIFKTQESLFRSFTSADDLGTLDLNGGREYKTFPGEDFTIPRGYSSVVESLASVLPVGMVQFGRKVDKIEWQLENGHGSRPVKLRFSDGSFISADHVIVTVSLGVLKRGIEEDCSMFNPPLPSYKIQAISRLGYGVVDKVFLQLPSQETSDFKFPFLQMVFHPPDSEFKYPEIPNWIRRTSMLYPVYTNSRVALAWFTGQEALEVESLTEEEILNGFSLTVSNLFSSKLSALMNPNCNGSENCGLKFEKVLRAQWGTDPLFLGSYSYVAVGSSGDDFDALAEPLPQNSNRDSTPELQILFAGEATHRTHYSTTHGAYLSGLREAKRLLKYYNCTGLL